MESLADFGTELLAGIRAEQVPEFALEISADIRLESVADFIGIRTGARARANYDTRRLCQEIRPRP